ncbi:MAG: hypothetical protein MZV63_47090 [Marinilabiliales bacterium]|nr:hypothetical protein [Marinilabiliales bacterium]
MERRWRPKRAPVEYFPLFGRGPRAYLKALSAIRRRPKLGRGGAYPCSLRILCALRDHAAGGYGGRS